MSLRKRVKELEATAERQAFLNGNALEACKRLRADLEDEKRIRHSDKERLIRSEMDLSKFRQRLHAVESATWPAPTEETRSRPQMLSPRETWRLRLLDDLSYGWFHSRPVDFMKVSAS